MDEDLRQSQTFSSGNCRRSIQGERLGFGTPTFWIQAWQSLHWKFAVRRQQTAHLPVDNPSGRTRLLSGTHGHTQADSRSHILHREHRWEHRKVKPGKGNNPTYCKLKKKGLLNLKLGNLQQDFSTHWFRWKKSFGAYFTLPFTCLCSMA